MKDTENPSGEKYLSNVFRFQDAFWLSKEKMYRTAVFYDRTDDGDYTGLTTVIAVDKNGNVGVGFSHCNTERDTFNRKLGRHIASCRALKILETGENFIAGTTKLMTEPNPEIPEKTHYIESGLSLTRLKDRNCYGVFVPQQESFALANGDHITVNMFSERELMALRKILNIQ